MPPFYMIDKTHGRLLELGGDGSFQACQAFLRELVEHFGAEYREHLECGSCPDMDKETGYWNVEMFGQAFFVMRDRGRGMCIWGPQPPADIGGFLRVAAHFKAREYVPAAVRVGRFLHLSKRYVGA